MVDREVYLFEILRLANYLGCEAVPGIVTEPPKGTAQPTIDLPTLQCPCRMCLRSWICYTHCAETLIKDHSGKAMNRKPKRSSVDPNSEEAWHLSQIRQRPSRFNVNKIGSSVKRLMTQAGYGQTKAVEDLHRLWAETVGEQLSARSRPGNLSRGVLTVHVADSPTMQEIYFMKRQIVKKLQEKMTGVKLKDIRTRVSNF